MNKYKEKYEESDLKLRLVFYELNRSVTLNKLLDWIKCIFDNSASLIEYDIDNENTEFGTKKEIKRLQVLKKEQIKMIKLFQKVIDQKHKLDKLGGGIY